MCFAHLTIVFEPCFYTVQHLWHFGQKRSPQRRISSIDDPAAPLVQLRRTHSSSASTPPTASSACSAAGASPTSCPQHRTSSRRGPHRACSSAIRPITEVTAASTSQPDASSPHVTWCSTNTSSRSARLRHLLHRRRVSSRPTTQKMRRPRQMWHPSSSPDIRRGRALLVHSRVVALNRRNPRRVSRQPRHRLRPRP